MSTSKYEFFDTFPFQDVWERVKNSTDIKSQDDLGKAVGVSQGAISGWKKKDVWPEEWAVRIARKYGYLTEWILTGSGPKNLSDFNESESISNQTLRLADMWLSQLVKDDSRKKVWFDVAFEEAFPMFREWRKRREMEESRGDIDPQSNVA